MSNSVANLIVVRDYISSVKLRNCKNHKKNYHSCVNDKKDFKRCYNIHMLKFLSCIEESQLKMNI